MVNSFSTRGEPTVSQLMDVDTNNVINGQGIIYENGIYTNQSVVTGDISGGNEGDTLVINSSGGVESNSVLRIDTVNNRVGINKDPTEDLDIDGNIQINSNGTNKIVFNDTSLGGHKHAEIDAGSDGASGGNLQFHTKIDGLGVTEKLRINNKGAIGIGGANFGGNGTIFTSRGSSDAPYWQNLERSAAYATILTPSVAGQTIPNSVPTAVNFTSYAGNNLWSGTLYTFNNSGDYLITFCCDPTGQGNTDVVTNSVAYLEKNGSTIFNLSTQTGSGENFIRLPIVFSTVESYSAGDTLGIDLLLICTSGNPFITQLGTRLTITQLV